MWVEKYDLREVPERRLRRLMEAENKKLRDAAKKERNEEVRVGIQQTLVYSKIILFVFLSYQYSRTSIARTLMAHSPWLARTITIVPAGHFIHKPPWMA